MRGTDSVTSNAWRTWLFIALALFLCTRATTLMSFPIFNDEAIYLQYSQLIHADWAKNKFISMHGEYNDWKPPLQYWLGAAVIDWGSDPLLAGRSVAFAVSLAGFFGFYFFATELFGQREGVVTAALYVLCPAVLFHNNQFIAETFLFSTAPFLYWALLKAMRRQPIRWIAWWILAVAFGAALLLFKQAGLLLLGVSIFLPLAQLGSRSPGPARWKQFAANAAIAVAVIICARLIASALLPPEFNETRERFDSNWVMSPREVISLPLRAWKTNLAIVGDYIGSYYSWLVPAVVGAFVWLAVQRKGLPELALVSMCAAGALAVCFLLRGFNEYIFNTAIIVALLPILARAGVLLWERAHSATVVRRGLVAVAGFTAAYWVYQIALMGISPGRYVERSTRWAIANYLTAWPTGFGIKEVVALLEREKQPGVIFADAQWGNPRTALEVYRNRRFPNLRIMPVVREYADPQALATIAARVKTVGPVRFAIFSADKSGGRVAWQRRLQSELCEQRTEIAAYPGQMPIVVCRF